MCFLIRACKSVLALLIVITANMANATTVSYTDRSTFESALSAFTVDDLNDISQGFQNSTSRTDYTIISTWSGLYGCSTFGCFDNSSIGFNYPAYIWLNRKVTSAFSFVTPVNALGFDYANPGTLTGAVPVLHGETASATSGFFGIISDVAQSAFWLSQNGPLIIDNITYGTGSSSVVPLPAAWPLFGTGLAVLGFTGWRKKRRRTAAA